MISLSADTEAGKVSIESVFDKELNPNEDEIKLIESVLSFLSPDVSRDITLERRSKDYISMFYGANDFLRFKYSLKTKWVSLRLPHELSIANTDNPLFAAQSNKKQLHWRANLNSLDDLNLLKDFIIVSCVYIPK